MSNVLTGNPLVLDTDGATLLSTKRLEIVKIRWVSELGSQGDLAIIQDGDGVTRWKSVCDGANYVESESWHPDYPFVADGLILDTLGSGTLYLYLRQKAPV